MYIEESSIKNKKQLERFAAVGIINTVLDFGLLFVFTSLGLPVGVANIFSTSIAFIFSFFANKNYTFKSTDANVAREMILFVIVTLVGLWVLQTIIIHLMLPFLGEIFHSSSIGLLAAKLLATGISLIWNYILYDKLVFKKS